MAQSAEQQIAPVEAGEAIEGAAQDTREDILSDAASGRAASASPELGVEQQRPEDDLPASDLATEDGAVRPASAAAPEAPSGSGGSASGSAAPKAAPAPTMREKILALKEEQRALRASSKAKTREIRNAGRRIKRLKDKVGGLADEDLSEVLRACAEAKALAAPKAEATAKAKAWHFFSKTRN